MLYIIGGASRAGKSTLARNIMLKYNIPYFSLDLVYMGFQGGFPEIGIDKEEKFGPTRAKIMWPFVRKMLEFIIENNEDYIIEGVFIIPEQVTEIQNLYSNTFIKSCFIGYKDINVSQKVREIKDNPNHPHNWLKNSSRHFIKHVIHTHKIYSQYLYKECVKYNIKYFESSEGFSETLFSAEKHLVQGMQ